VSSKTYKENVLTYTVGAKMSSMPKSRLPELIEKARKSGLTFRDIRRRSGDQIPLSSHNAWHKSRPPNPNLTTETICALAKGMGESPTEVFEAVIGKGTATGTIKDESLRQVLEDFGRLSSRDQNDPLLRAILEMFRTEIQKRLDRNA